MMDIDRETADNPTNIIGIVKAKFQKMEKRRTAHISQLT